MAPIEDLKRILLLQDFTDSMLEELKPLVQSRKGKEKEIIFNENEPAEFFLMLKTGKVLLEVEVSPWVMMSLGSVKSGHSFGWSALSSADRTHKSNALCTEPSEILLVPGAEFLKILDRHPEPGYRVMKNIFAIFKRRLERRTVQLINVIRNYPEMSELVQE
ncbi:MAG: cyclic nucleotide-binding domain-containing protein [Deltaproteobacteria bacterium]|nr:cyclic nucleotide-binding domain-containing protein [Deltaproteobacteria bacterium]